MLYEIPSLCIPYSICDFTEEDIRDTFISLFDCPFESIRRIDEIIKINPDETQFKLFFIHFNPIKLNEMVIRFFKEMNKYNNVRIQFTDEWFWKVSLSFKSNIKFQLVDEELYSKWDTNINTDYYEYIDSIISPESCIKMSSFLDETKYEINKLNLGLNLIINPKLNNELIDTIISNESCKIIIDFLDDKKNKPLIFIINIVILYIINRHYNYTVIPYLTYLYLLITY